MLGKGIYLKKKKKMKPQGHQCHKFLYVKQIYRVSEAATLQEN
jgi:hypothetical protein